MAILGISFNTGGSLAPSNVLGIGDNADDGLQAATAAQLESTDAQLQLGRENIDFLKETGERAEERLQPFVDVGVEGIPEFLKFLDPQAQVDFLQNNPLFQAAIDETSRSTTAFNAAQGRGGGGVVDQLFKNFLSTGSNFVSDRFNQLLSPISIGQPSAAGSAANILNTGNAVSAGNANLSNIHGNIGDINASSAIQGQNIRNQQQQGMFDMISGGVIGSGALGGAGIAGGGAAGAGLGALLFSDARLKDIGEKIGEDEDGIPIYEWKYKGDDVTHFGPMAQDVEKVNPDAVLTHESGFKVLDMRAV